MRNAGTWATHTALIETKLACSLLRQGIIYIELLLIHQHNSFRHAHKHFQIWETKYELV